MSDGTTGSPEKDKQESEAFMEHRKTFYALIGQCMTMYQVTEDYLPELFAASLGGEPKRAKAIFAQLRGLEAKLGAITASLIGNEGQHQKRWSELLPRIASAASARNQIAHSISAQNAVEITVVISEDPSVPSYAMKTGIDRMELHKNNKKGTSIWTESMMVDEHNNLQDLFRCLRLLCRQLNGETP